MNRQFIISVVVLFIVTMTFGFLIHGQLLYADYASLPNIMRTEADAQAKFHFMILAHLLISIGLTWIYRMGKTEGADWIAQGARFGLAIAVVSTIPFFLIYYVVQQTPEMLTVKQIGFELVAMVLVGMVTAFLNR
jgi:hypothetical protein